MCLDWALQPSIGRLFGTQFGGPGYGFLFGHGLQVGGGVGAYWGGVLSTRGTLIGLFFGTRTWFEKWGLGMVLRTCTLVV